MKVSSKLSNFFSPTIFALIHDFQSSHFPFVSYNYTCTLKGTAEEEYFMLRLYLTRTKTHFFGGLKNENKTSSNNNIFKNKLEKQINEEDPIFTPPQKKDILYFFKKFKLFFMKFMNLSRKIYSKVSRFFSQKNRKTFIFLSLSPLFQSMNLKKAQELNNFKDQMLANVAHDLRSPINGILAFLELARESNEEREREKNINYAKLSSHLLLNLISDILDFSQIRKGKLSIHISPFFLHELLDETLMNIELQAKLKGIILQVQNDFAPDFEIISDKRRISQLLLNLLGNAVKFTKEGVIKLKVCHTRYKNVMKFEIIDSGIGIKPNLLSQLFQAFATFDTENGLNKYGIGLGLNICKMIVKLIGPSEDLYVSSKYQKGTKFGFLIFTELNKKGGRKTYPVTNKSIQSQANCLQSFSRKNLPFGTQENNSSKISLSNSKQIKRNLTEKIRKEKHFRESNHYQKLEIKGFKDEKEEISLNKMELKKSDSVRKRAKTPIIKNSFKFEEDYALEIGSFKSPESLIDEIPTKAKKPHHKRDSLSEKDKSLIITSFVNVQSLKQINLQHRTHSNKKSRRKRRRDRQSSLPNIDNLKTIAKKIDCDELLAKNFLNESKQVIAYDYFSSFDEDEANEGYLNGIDEFPTGKMISPITRISSSFRGSSFNFDMYLKKLNILIVDDNPFNILIISEYLKKAVNYKISIFSTYNGSLAVEYFQKCNKINQANPIDIIFMDCQMPIMDGFEASKKIKELIESKEYQDTYIVAITAYMDEKKCYDSGMDDFLMKPVSIRELLLIFEQFLCEN